MILRKPITWLSPVPGKDVLNLWRERHCELQSRNLCSWNAEDASALVQCEAHTSCKSYRQLKNFAADWLNLIDFLPLSPLSLSRPPKWSPGEVRAAGSGRFSSLRGQAQGESHTVKTHIKTASPSHSVSVFYTAFISAKRSAWSKSRKN